MFRRTLCSSSTVCRVPPQGPFIEVVEPQDAVGELKECYAKYGKPDGSVDNIDKVHSLNPASMVSHEVLYKQCMKEESPLSFVEREVVAVVVSNLNNCGY
eukprot:TRINITY_DN9479_c6_g1_i1.p1 TRINITY_DN9479_c6_g1~~TRINITY_DN9479_c6_g1_i1.p1  ORF type:complete len:117 (+),score=39.96 TRINITY_DN9479_c6_g1_i1:54-353(+)